MQARDRRHGVELGRQLQSAVMRNSHKVALGLLIATATACNVEPHSDQAPAYEVDSTACGPDHGGNARAQGTLTNKGALPRSYNLTLRFVVPGAQDIETSAAFPNIAPDDSSGWTIRAGAPWVPGSTCKVVEVVEQGMF